VVIGTDYVGSFKSKYNTITTPRTKFDIYVFIMINVMTSILLVLNLLLW